MKGQMISKLKGTIAVPLVCLTLACWVSVSQATEGQPQTQLRFRLFDPGDPGVSFVFTEMHSGVGSGTRTEDVRPAGSPWIIRVPDKSQTQYLHLVRPLTKDLQLWGLRQLVIDRAGPWKRKLQFEILDASMKSIATFELWNAYVASLEVLNDLEGATIIYDEVYRKK